MCSYYFKCFWILNIKFWFWDNCWVMCSCQKWCRSLHHCLVFFNDNILQKGSKVSNIKYWYWYSQDTEYFHYQKDHFLFFVFWSYCTACGILASWPGIEPMPLHWKHSLNHWTTLSLYNFILHTPPSPILGPGSHYSGLHFCNAAF